MDYLYGEINKEVTPVYYTGMTTSTTTTVVDNENFTISVNVNVDAVNELVAKVVELQEKVNSLEAQIGG